MKDLRVVGRNPAMVVRGKNEMKGLAHSTECAVMCKRSCLLPDIFGFLHICHIYVFQIIKQMFTLDKMMPVMTRCSS